MKRRLRAPFLVAAADQLVVVAAAALGLAGVGMQRREVRAAFGSARFFTARAVLNTAQKVDQGGFSFVPSLHDVSRSRL